MEDKTLQENISQNESDSSSDNRMDDVNNIINDDISTILDDRGLYKINDEFLVKINRIEVRQMMAIWTMITSIFTNISTMNLDFKAPSTWFLILTTSASLSPVNFYKFLVSVLELQYQGTNHKEREDERIRFERYIQRDLKLEELLDIFSVVYNQEKDRLGELLKKVEKLFGPLMNQLKKELTEPLNTGSRPLI